jgi:hypothetical protein
MEIFASISKSRNV